MIPILTMLFFNGALQRSSLAQFIIQKKKKLFFYLFDLFFFQNIKSLKIQVCSTLYISILDSSGVASHN